MQKLLLALLLLFTTGCMSQQALNTQIQTIQQKHNVIIKADNPMSRCFLFGDLPGLLNRIEKDLDKCPDYFKANIGPILIEESFVDNPGAYPLPGLLRGYVNIEEKGWPIHVKNRSLLEKIVLWAPRDKDVFLHEASHSFEFNMGTNSYEQWLAFYNEFDRHSKNYGGAATSLLLMAIPQADLIKPAGMSTLYSSVNHFEDFAETHCYLRRHNIESIREKDPLLYEKCKIVEKFTNGSFRKKTFCLNDKIKEVLSGS